MRLIATQEIRVFVDNNGSPNTQISYIPKDRREDINWKGCLYTIKEGEEFSFDRGNDWDKSYFKLSNGAEFLIWCSDPKIFIHRNNVKFIN
tara:strand:- start:105 stop:377 length:273 start_codon:yes stop_codon:yes gene_type:complete